jgi:hypothetical protein
MTRLSLPPTPTAPTFTAPPPNGPETLNAAAQVLHEVERWCPRFERGELHPGGRGHRLLEPQERFAVHVGHVRAAGLGNPATSGALHATDRRAIVMGEAAEPLREWTLTELRSVSALGNWGGIALVHDGGDTELVVAAKPELPSWQDASDWLKVEAAFAAAEGRLGLWLDQLPGRLALALGA